MISINLHNRFIFITGGLGAIAESILRRLLEAGATLVITDLLPVDEAERRLEGYNLPSRNWRYLRCDVTDLTSIATAVGESFTLHPELDCFVGLAGGCALHPFASTSPTEYRRIFDYNYYGHVDVARSITQHWTERSIAGHAVFTTSLVGSLPWVDLSAYAPAKAAIEMFAKCLALEFATQGIRFNCIAPGHVATGSSLKVYDEDQGYRSLVDRAIPLKRLIRPESIADAFLWLISSLAQDVNGQIIKVDCGASIPKVG